MIDVIPWIHNLKYHCFLAYNGNILSYNSSKRNPDSGQATKIFQKPQTPPPLEAFFQIQKKQMGVFTNAM